MPLLSITETFQLGPRCKRVGSPYLEMGNNHQLYIHDTFGNAPLLAIIAKVVLNKSSTPSLMMESDLQMETRRVRCEMSTPCEWAEVLRTTTG